MPFVCFCAERKMNYWFPAPLIHLVESQRLLQKHFVVGDLERAGCKFVWFIRTAMSHACFIICRFCWPYLLRWGTAIALCLRCCATNRKVAGSIPEASLELFIDVILLIALWSLSRLRLLQKRQKEIFPEGKNGRCVRLTTLTPS